VSERAIQLTGRLSRRLAEMQHAASVCQSWADVCDSTGVRLQAVIARMRCKRYERALARAALLGAKKEG
jgi:hypothetical protein